MAARRRKAKGPRGQAPGTITTDPNEVDAIIREAYGKIYAGNVKKMDVHKLIDDYMYNYKKYISKTTEMDLEDITDERTLIHI